MQTRQDIQDAIFETELLVERYRVSDGPATAKQRVEHNERCATVRSLTKIRKALYLALDLLPDEVKEAA